MSFNFRCRDTDTDGDKRNQQSGSRDQQPNTEAQSKKCSGAYRGWCKEEAKPVYLFLRFRKTLQQDLKNSLIKVFSIHGLYTGRFLGLTSTVHSIEGEWPKQFGIAMMKFECMEEAYKWVHSTPAIQQRDWIDGVDMVAVPCCNKPPSNGKLCFQLMEVSFTDERAFVEDYSPKAQQYLQKSNAVPGVVSTCDGKNLRGNWMCSSGASSFIIINQFDSLNHFEKVFCADENKSLRAMRNQTADCKTFVFQLEPLMG